jgi:hypothetical protein
MMRARSKDAEPEQRKGRSGGLFLLLIVVVVGVLAVNESARNVVLDLLFGAEEEFEYSSITEPVAASAPAVS